MKLSKHVEESLYVILILATQKKHQPVKSVKLSEILDVSDSSLKKVLHKLVVKEIISSAASKDGGFELKKEINQLTLLDIVEAIEGNELIQYVPNNIVENIFTRKEHAQKSEQYIVNGFRKARDAYASALKEIKIATILEEHTIEQGAIDWAKFKPIERKQSS
ncbi:RrF2 family transcriptional regulator [Oenococcus sp.]|uniref:RrF2 family transcriptional regulator n=1 Tax=Oenococcus sp. TaxID=1979414 RepID=UPI0039ECB3C4